MQQTSPLLGRLHNSRETQTFDLIELTFKKYKIGPIKKRKYKNYTYLYPQKIKWLRISAEHFDVDFQVHFRGKFWDILYSISPPIIMKDHQGYYCDCCSVKTHYKSPLRLEVNHFHGIIRKVINEIYNSKFLYLYYAKGISWASLKPRKKSKQYLRFVIPITLK